MKADPPIWDFVFVGFPDKPTRILETDNYIYYYNEIDGEEYCYFTINKACLKEWE